MMTALGARALYRARRQQAERQHDAEAAALAAAQKMNDIPDDWVAKAVDHIANNRQVWVSTDGLRAYWQEQNVPPERLSEHLNTIYDGLGDAFTLAEAANGNVPIDAGVFLGQMGRKETGGVQHVKLSFFTKSPTKKQDSE